jgi:hypothetical protein
MLRGLRQTINEWLARRALHSARETRRRAARDPAFRAHLERYEADERPVLDALADSGLRLRRLADLINRDDIDYAGQVPVLIEWLPRVRYAPVKSGIARALTVRAARPAAAAALLHELRQAPHEEPPLPRDADPFERTANSNVRLLRQALGNALAFTADRSHFDAIAQLIQDPETGSARPSLIEYLGRFRDQRAQAIPILQRLLTDDDLGRYALKPLAKLRAVGARPDIERFLHHEQDWVRRDAKRALARLGASR